MEAATCVEGARGGTPSPRHSPHTPPASLSARPGTPHFAHSSTRSGGRTAAGSGGILLVRRLRIRAAGQWTGIAGGQGVPYGILVRPSLEPLLDQRGQRRAVRLGQGQDGRYGRGRPAG